MVEAPVGTDVDPLPGSKGPERRPHDGAVHHLRPYHDHLDTLVTWEHVVQLVEVCHLGRQGFWISCSHQVDGERFGIRQDVEQSHPPGDAQWPGEELATNPPQWLPQVTVVWPRSSGVGPEGFHVGSGQDGVKVSSEASLHGEPVVPAFNLRLGLRPFAWGERKVACDRKGDRGGVSLDSRSKNSAIMNHFPNLRLNQEVTDSRCSKKNAEQKKIWR